MLSAILGNIMRARQPLMLIELRTLLHLDSAGSGIWDAGRRDAGG